MVQAGPGNCIVNDQINLHCLAFTSSHHLSHTLVCILLLLYSMYSTRRKRRCGFRGTIRSSRRRLARHRGRGRCAAWSSGLQPPCAGLLCHHDASSMLSCSPAPRRRASASARTAPPGSTRTCTPARRTPCPCGPNFKRVTPCHNGGT